MVAASAAAEKKASTQTVWFTTAIILSPQWRRKQKTIEASMIEGAKRLARRENLLQQNYWGATAHLAPRFMSLPAASAASTECC